jgi:hypothetical protein
VQAAVQIWWIIWMLMTLDHPQVVQWMLMADTIEMKQRNQGIIWRVSKKRKECYVI